MNSSQLKQFYDLCNSLYQHVSDLMHKYFTLPGPHGGTIKVLPQEYEFAEKEIRTALSKDLTRDELRALASNFIASAKMSLDVASNTKPKEKLDFREKILDALEYYQGELHQESDRAISAANIESNLKILNRAFNSQTKQSKALEEKLDLLSRGLESVSGPLERKVAELDLKFKDEMDHLEKKREEIDTLTSVVSGRAITSSYQKSAISEGRAANWLRIGALVFMVLAISFGAFSALHTSEHFDLGLTIVRILFALVLSIPAAYLARESAKHRKQQYEHLQIALDVEAIGPYTTSLPLEMQYKLKKSMASRIFVAKNFDHITKESYPINLQEALLAALNALQSAQDKKKKDKKKKKEKDQAEKKKNESSNEEKTDKKKSSTG